MTIEKLSKSDSGVRPLDVYAHRRSEQSRVSCRAWITGNPEVGHRRLRDRHLPGEMALRTKDAVTGNYTERVR